MQITLGSQYNVGEKPTVILCVCVCVFFPSILYIYINRHAGTPANQRQCSRPSHMVVVIYITKTLSTKPLPGTWYLTGFPTGSNLGSTV